MAYVIEGTWEEIKRHEAELIGCHLRVTVTSEDLPEQETDSETQKPTPTKTLRGRGSLAGILSTEDYFREKRADTICEDRPRQ